MLNGVKQYVQDQITLTKLETVEAVSKIASKIVLFGLIAILGLFLILIGSLTLAWFLSTLVDSVGLGFLIVAGIYLLIIVLLFMFKKQIQDAIVNLAIGAAIKDEVDVNKLKERN